MAGKLSRPAGRPAKVKSLFKVIGEKIPYSFLNAVKKELDAKGLPKTGVYIAHDSMGYPRYVGRGSIFNRLDVRQKAQVLELSYFSFFIVENKIHEREIETIMIRAAGPLLDFNDRKKGTIYNPVMYEILSQGQNTLSVNLKEASYQSSDAAEALSS